ncbi:MAG: hypothetical protein M3164_01485, partial [Actinomycetota bacterium]|nr:hypothetical protein [Actinomycetota bacterium]
MSKAYTPPAVELKPDHTGLARLDGVWEFFPGDGTLEELSKRVPDLVTVPGLWEAQGYLELDGFAWYRKVFDLESSAGYWTLEFGAVMDIADVYLNGRLLGRHEAPFTPFELDVSEALRDGRNTLLVRVQDPAVSDPEHLRLPHGKQGWANHFFPSRPSLYMTYGGIWQPVTLRRHGPLIVRSVFFNSDPDDLRVEVVVENRDEQACRGRVAIRTIGLLYEHALDLAPKAQETLAFALGPTSAPRWSPSSPALHDAFIDLILDDGRPSDMRSSRFGLRRVEVRGTQLLIDGTPFRMKSVLVQGFRPDALYAEGTRAQIEQEVRQAKEAGFNTVRLHIKAFDPAYLDVCDELGMCVHSDIPVAEPIQHEELGDDSIVYARCRQAAREQVVRDRNHPCIIIWSAMNELCLDRPEARDWEGYERFVRAMVKEIEACDPTRLIIENDWVEPDPSRVFVARILTAHWYGRLHADYLNAIDEKARLWSELDRPLLITEFGDWGLPEMRQMADAPFWDTHDIYAADLAVTLWPDSVDRFVVETQRYQGLSDRLQMEV